MFSVQVANIRDTHYPVGIVAVLKLLKLLGTLSAHNATVPVTPSKH